MIIAGIDEAGRGPALGPMVISLAILDSKSFDKLQNIGLRDSKLLSPIQRERLYKKLQSFLFVKTAHIYPQELDSLMQNYSLNEIEAIKISELLNNLEKKPDIVYIDCPDTLPSNFIKRLKKYLKFQPKIFAEHKADSTYPIVSAASIFAKVERDRAIYQISQKYGDIGSGYSSDDKTISFIKNYLKEKGTLPPFARKLWATNKRLKTELSQKKIFDFGN